MKIKKIKRKKKKGEVTLAQLIPIIIAIASFAVLLFIWYRLNYGGGGSLQTCHNSVVLTALTKTLLGRPNCRTQYVCISGGDKCNNINPTETIKLDTITKEGVLKAIADKTAECWSTFGEGSLDYVARDRFKVYNSACALCHVIKFDDKIKNKLSAISYKDFFNYLANNKMPGSEQTYLTYLYPFSNNDLNAVFSTFSQMKIDNESKSILLGEDYVTLTGEVKIDFIAAFIFNNKEGFIGPYFLNSNDIPYLKCGEFLTKVA